MFFSYADDILQTLTDAVQSCFTDVRISGKVRMPDGDCHAGVFIPGDAALDTAAEALRNKPLHLYDAPLWYAVHAEGRMLRFDFSPAFFESLLYRIANDLPLPETGPKNEMLNRFLRLSAVPQKERQGSITRLFEAHPKAGLCLIGFLCPDRGTGLPKLLYLEEGLTTGLSPTRKLAFFQSAAPFYDGLARLTYAYINRKDEIL